MSIVVMQASHDGSYNYCLEKFISNFNRCIQILKGGRSSAFIS